MFSHKYSSHRQEEQQAKRVLFYQQNVFSQRERRQKVPREVSKLVMILKLNGK
jgi:hypothetical protein